MDRERKARLEKMVATNTAHVSPIKGVVNVGVVLSLKPILKTWQLCLSFKLDVQRHLQVKEIDHELLSASLILLYIYLNL